MLLTTYYKFLDSNQLHKNKIKLNDYLNLYHTKINQKRKKENKTKDLSIKSLTTYIYIVPLFFDSDKEEAK